MTQLPETIATEQRSDFRKRLDHYRKYPSRKINRFLNRHWPNTSEVFYILSTGRAGSTFASHLLNLAPNATVLHQPPPGLEKVNPIAYNLFKNDLSAFLSIAVDDFDLLQQHAEIYLQYRKAIFGDGHNANYPFAISLNNYFAARGIGTRFIHLVRDPYTCCEAIMRAEGPHSFGVRRNFGTRAPGLRIEQSPAKTAANVWLEINNIIDFQIRHIEEKSPGATSRMRAEDLNEKKLPTIRELFEFLSLRWPGDASVRRYLKLPGAKRNSYKGILRERGVPEVSEEDRYAIREATRDTREYYGY